MEEFDRKHTQLQWDPPECTSPKPISEPPLVKSISKLTVYENSYSARGTSKAGLNIRRFDSTTGVSRWIMYVPSDDCFCPQAPFLTVAKVMGLKCAIGLKKRLGSWYKKYLKPLLGPAFMYD